jgi:hypothetical protein
VGNLNTPLSLIDRSFGQNINKETSELIHSLDQMDIIETYRVFQSNTMQYKFFSAAHGTFSKIDHNLGHKASLNTFKKIEITPCIISDHNGIKLELNNKGNRKYSKHGN